MINLQHPEPGRKTQVVLIGQAPSRSGDPCYPLTGRFGRKIQELARITEWTYLRKTVRINVLPVYPGTNGKGDAFPLNKARHMARTIAELGVFDCGRDVVMFGWNVARVFGMPKTAWLMWERPYRVLGEPCSTRVAVSPHPSGVSTWWNDPENLRRASAFWRGLLA